MWSRGCEIIGLLIANTEGDAWTKMLQIVNKGNSIGLTARNG